MSAAQQPAPAVSRVSPASRSGFKQWVTRHPILAYLILAYVVSWTIFLIPLLSKEGIGLLAFDAPPVQLFILLVSMVGLAGSAFTVTAMVDGRAGVRTLAGRYLRWRVGVQWCLLAMFGLLAVALVGTSVVYGFSTIGELVRHPLARKVHLSL
jgi:uncharacterized protein